MQLHICFFKNQHVLLHNHQDKLAPPETSVPGIKIGLNAAPAGVEHHSLDAAGRVHRIVIRVISLWDMILLKGVIVV